jgi:thiol-disulfide isomerase/thioredoxin
MYKTIPVLMLLFLIPVRLTAQDLNRAIPDPKTGEDMLCGYCDRDGLSEGSFREWFQPEYEQYLVDHVKLSSLNQDLFLISDITVVMGTWCSDSRREVPRFIKIIDELGAEVNAINLICVDRAKNADVPDMAELQIELVPTIIFYLQGDELGRITETPHESLESDMVQIFNQ